MLEGLISGQGMLPKSAMAPHCRYTQEVEGEFSKAIVMNVRDQLWQKYLLPGYGQGDQKVSKEDQDINMSENNKTET